MPFAARSAPVTATALIALAISAAGALAAEALGAAQASSAASPATLPVVVHYHDGLLSVRAHGVPLAEVLQALEAESGLRFDGEALDQRDVWKRFRDVPLAEGLRRVIGHQNFTLTYGNDGSPRRVELLGVPQLPPTHRPTNMARLSFPVLLVREPPILVSARAAAALRSARMIPLIQLMRGLRIDDPAVRGEAVDAFLRALRRNPTLRATFVALPDVNVVGLARAWAGPHAGDVLRAIAARALHTDLRGLAQRALRRLEG